MHFPTLSPKSLVLSPTLILLALLAGCNAVGAIAYKLGPPPRTPAKYKPAQELAVIVVENYRNPSASDVDSEQLARLIGDELRNNKVVPLVAENAVQHLRDVDREKFRAMTIPAIGRAVGAKQVIYVDLVRSSMEVAVGESMVRGSMDATVRVVDATTGQTRWPSESQQGWPVSVQSPFTTVDEKASETAFRRKMHESMALQVSHLFYDWLNDFEASDVGRN